MAGAIIDARETALATIAAEAGALALDYFGKLDRLGVSMKGAQDWLTEADGAVERLIRARIAAAFPTDAIVGEELGGEAGDLTWIIDPIDGTNNYAAGKMPFGIMVSLSQSGETIAGWIYDPMSPRLCHAHLGQGAFVGDYRTTARTTGQVPPIAAISLVFMDPSRREAMKAHIAPHYSLVDIPRCAAEQYPRLVLGTNDVSIFERTLAWDHAAGVLFVNEAGGKAARPDGRPYRVDEAHLPGLIGAASEALWDDLAGRLAQL